MTVIIDDIVRLDQMNMSAIIEASGGLFSPERRKNALLRELSEGSQFVTEYIGCELVGYIQFSAMDEQGFFVVSLQVHFHHRNGIVLKKLLRSFAAQLIQMNPDYLTSSVHISNGPSIRLHQKLGFQVTEQTEERMLFMLKKPLLMQQMARLGGI